MHLFSLSALDMELKKKQFICRCGGISGQSYKLTKIKSKFQLWLDFKIIQIGFRLGNAQTEETSLWNRVKLK